MMREPATRSNLQECDGLRFRATALGRRPVRRVVLDGIPDFEKLHSDAHNDHVFLYGFDLLELNGEDWRPHPLEKRKAKLEQLLTNIGECTLITAGVIGSFSHRWRGLEASTPAGAPEFPSPRPGS